MAWERNGELYYSLSSGANPDDIHTGIKGVTPGAQYLVKVAPFNSRDIPGPLREVSTTLDAPTAPQNQGGSGTDVDNAGVTVSHSSLNVPEGGSATYTVVLDAEPASNVVVAMSSDNDDVATQSASLTFTTGNWQTAQTVTVRAAHDDAAGDSATIIHTASGADGYNGIAVASVTVSVTDLLAEYDANGNGTIEINELFSAIDDYFDGVINTGDLFTLIDLYFGDPG